MANYTTTTSDKNKGTAAALCAVGFLGLGGLHLFYVGRIGKGILYLCTGGLFIFGTIIDLISILTGGFRDNVGAPLRTNHTSARAVPAPASAVARPSAQRIPTEIDGHKMSYNYDDVRIAVIRGQEPDFTMLSVGAVVKLEQERDNEYDKNAVAVTFNGIGIGYLYKGKLQDMTNDYINKGLPIFSIITDLDEAKSKIELYISYFG